MQRVRDLEKAAAKPPRISDKDYEAIGAGVAKLVAPLVKRIKELEVRSVMLFKGVWDVLGEYERGHVVTHDGGLWSCLETCKGQRPGKTPDWRLIAKSGTPAK